MTCTYQQDKVGLVVAKAVKEFSQGIECPVTLHSKRAARDGGHHGLACELAFVVLARENVLRF